MKAQFSVKSLLIVTTIAGLWMSGALAATAIRREFDDSFLINTRVSFILMADLAAYWFPGLALAYAAGRGKVDFNVLVVAVALEALGLGITTFMYWRG